jgi:hypothetical protein
MDRRGSILTLLLAAACGSAGLAGVPQVERLPDGPANLQEQRQAPELTQPVPALPRLPSPPGPYYQDETCPSVRDLKPITQIELNLAPPPPGEYRDVNVPRDCPLDGDPFSPRAWQPATLTWIASGLHHGPLYFEEPQLERYGHFWPGVQPFLSGAHFFGTLPVLPYKMGLEPPLECIYPLGYYQPGECAPHSIPPVPLNLQAALLEAGTVTGLIFLIP